MKHVMIIEDVAEAQRWLSGIVSEAFPDAQIRMATSVNTANAQIDAPLDLALIDLGLPDGSGLDVLRAARRAHPQATCIVTTIMSDDASIVGALSAGADGYLLKETASAVLIRQLEQLSIGLPALSPAVARRVMEHFRQTGPVAEPEAQLTLRETQVLELISRGLRNSEVATQMGIASTTVAGYIKIIYRKLGIGSRAEAAWHAARLVTKKHPEDL